MKRILCLMVVLVLCIPGAWAAEYHTLRQGDTGEEVQRLKERMYDLGYFTTRKLTAQFNGTMTERVKLLQKANGLTETGVVTPELQELIYSDDCVWQAPTPVPTPVPTATPAPIAPSREISFPARDEEGFLANGEPFIHADREDGRWVYLSGDIQVDIRRFESAPQQLTWFETDIRVRGDAKLSSFASNEKRPGKGDVMPTKIAKDHQAVFAFSDDFFGYRMGYGYASGIIIRNGTIVYEKTRKKGTKPWPPLDVLALYQDGSMKTFAPDAHTAQEYLDMGVRDTLAFGPILVQDGELSPDAFAFDEKGKEPRMALGMIASGHYVLLTAVGRTSASKGATIGWMAQKIHDMGAAEALNLDGGNTACLIFMGEILNHKVGISDAAIRKVSTMMGVREPD